MPAVPPHDRPLRQKSIRGKESNRENGNGHQAVLQQGDRLEEAKIRGKMIMDANRAAVVPALTWRKPEKNWNWNASSVTADCPLSQIRSKKRKEAKTTRGKNDRGRQK